MGLFKPIENVSNEQSDFYIPSNDILFSKELNYVFAINSNKENEIDNIRYICPFDGIFKVNIMTITPNETNKNSVVLYTRTSKYVNILYGGEESNIFYVYLKKGDIISFGFINKNSSADFTLKNIKIMGRKGVNPLNSMTEFKDILNYV